MEVEVEVNVEVEVEVTIMQIFVSKFFPPSNQQLSSSHKYWVSYAGGSVGTELAVGAEQAVWWLATARAEVGVTV